LDIISSHLVSVSQVDFTITIIKILTVLSVAKVNNIVPAGLNNAQVVPCSHNWVGFTTLVLIPVLLCVPAR
jgi:hypothetical protein